MKKIISFLLVMVLSLVFTFSAIGCGNTKGDSQSDISTSDSTSDSTGDSTKDPSDGYLEKNFDYVHVGFDVDFTKDSYYTLDGDMWIRLTDDFALVGNGNLTDQELPEEDTDSTDTENETSYTESLIYLINDYALTREKSWDEGETKPETYEDSISYVGLKDLADSDETAAQLISKVLTYVLENKSSLGKLGLQSFEYDIDVKQYLTSINDWLQTNKDNTLISLLAEALGDTEENLTNKITELFADNEDGEPVTIADMVDRVVAFVNDYSETKINLKLLCDAMQLKSNLDTKETVSKLREALKTALGEKASVVDTILGKVKDGQTLYDYFYDVLDGISVDTVLGFLSEDSEDSDSKITRATISDMIVGFINMDVKTLANTVFCMIANVPEEFDFVSVFNVFTKECVNELNFNIKFTVDDYGYPTEIVFDANIDVDPSAVSEDSDAIKVSAHVAFTVDYSENEFADVKFEMPSDAEYEPVIKGITSKKVNEALENGENVSVDIIPGTGKYADVALDVNSSKIEKINYATINSSSLTDDEKAQLRQQSDASKKIELLVINEDGSYEFKTIGDIEDGKIVLTAEYFETLISNDYDYDYITISADLTDLYFYDSCEIEF